MRGADLRNIVIKDLPGPSLIGTAILSQQQDTEFREKVQLATAHALTVKRQAPELTELWKPLAEHLNAQAVTLMDYERAPGSSDSPSMKTLRLQAKIHFLERYRQALWICSVVWAQMASAEVPAPLKDLRQGIQADK